MTARTATIMLALSLAACRAEPEQAANSNAAANPAGAEAPPPAPAPAPTAAPAVLLGADGVTLPGGTRAVFGQKLAAVEAAMAPLGAAKSSLSSDECPPGQFAYRDYPNGLQLAFMDGELVGWWANAPARGLATKSGVTLGSPRAALGNAPVSEESTGLNFAVDPSGDNAVYGVLDEKGEKVATLWAGMACIFH
jgi:hypothetical protein